MYVKNHLLWRGNFFGKICREVELREFSLKEVVDAGEEVPKHIHEGAHFLFIIKGLYISSAKNVNDSCSPSTLIFNPSGTTHRDRFQSAGGRFLAVSFKAQTTELMQRPTDLIDHSVAFSDRGISWIGSRLYEEFHQTDEASALVMEGLTLELLGHVLRCHRRSPTSPPRWLELARQMLHNRPTELITAREIAQTVGVHPVYLVSAFRKHYRVTIGDYVRRLRIEFACRQISQTNVSFSEIAVGAGFYDQSHFTRTFKSMMGMTPTQYRQCFRS
jgi:AraC family transcriptional regulator